jgi:phosphatidylglycerophosphate synthase
MRLADGLTLFRTFLIFVVAYMILVRFNPWAVVAALAFTYVIDGLDGYASLWSVSNGSLGISTYLRYSFGDKSDTKKIKSLKEKAHKEAKYGPRFDVAGDRVSEYVLWFLFTYLNIIPIFVLFIVILRNSFVDAFMGGKGTSSRLKTRFARAVYGSAAGRGGVNVVKWLTFSYLALVYLINWPVSVGYALTAILVIYIVLRGIAEMHESLA